MLDKIELRKSQDPVVTAPYGWATVSTKSAHSPPPGPFSSSHLSTRFAAVAGRTMLEQDLVSVFRGQTVGGVAVNIGTY